MVLALLLTPIMLASRTFCTLLALWLCTLPIFWFCTLLALWLCTLLEALWLCTLCTFLTLCALTDLTLEELQLGFPHMHQVRCCVLRDALAPATCWCCCGLGSCNGARGRAAPDVATMAVGEGVTTALDLARTADTYPGCIIRIGSEPFGG